MSGIGTGPAALVTGAGTGIGREIAERLAKAGYRVALADVDLPAAQAAAAACGNGAIAVRLDVTQADAIADGFAAAEASLGPLDLLVNNAGIALHRPALDLTPQDWDRVMDVNLKGAFFMSQRFAAACVAKGRPGAIVNLASAHGLVGLAQRAAYGISKAGIIHMSRMLAIEWAPQGIRVNAVAPGTVMTPSREALLSDPAARARMLERIPLGRFPSAAEIAGAVLYLAGPDAGAITGHTLVLDGGTTVW